MGGIPTNEYGEVQPAYQESVPGLFAVGECAAASFHGFNRLGANSILELITMGNFAGERIIQYLKETPGQLPEPEGGKTFQQFSQYLKTGGQDNIGQIREAMKSMMTEKVGVFRSEPLILEAIEALKALKERADNTALSGKSLRMNQELVHRWELDNLLSVSMVIAHASLNRKESRGAHFREDFPERKDEFNHHTLASMEEFGTVKLGKRAVDMSIYEAGGENSEKFGIIQRTY
jgi:succinate dehydrogenase / fumarate reductase flavoprotein subunit